MKRGIRVILLFLSIYFFVGNQFFSNSLSTKNETSVKRLLRIIFVSLIKRYIFNTQKAATMKLILTCFLLFTGITVSGQELNHKDKLIEFLGQERFDKINSQSNGYLRFLDLRCSDGWQIIDNIDGKFDQYEKLDSLNYSTPEKVINAVSAEEILNQINSGEFNLIKYTLKWDKDKTVYYVLGNTGKVLAIHPVEYINKLLNSELEK